MSGFFISKSVSPKNFGIFWNVSPRNIMIFWTFSIMPVLAQALHAGIPRQSFLTFSNLPDSPTHYLPSSASDGLTRQQPTQNTTPVPIPSHRKAGRAGWNGVGIPFLCFFSDCRYNHRFNNFTTLAPVTDCLPFMFKTEKPIPCITCKKTIWVRFTA